MAATKFRIYLHADHAAGPAHERGILPHQLHGVLERISGPNIFLQTQSKLTLPVVLNQYMGTYVQQYGIFLAGTLLAMIPPAILFFSLQREFI